MAKISDLPILATADVDGSELMPVVKGGTTRRTSGAGYFQKIAQPYVDALEDARDAPIARIVLDESSTPNALTGSLPSGMTAYKNGQLVYFVAAAVNTDLVTLDIGGLGPLQLWDERDGRVQPGDLVAGAAYMVRISIASTNRAKIIASHLSPRYLLASAPLTGAPTAPTPGASSNDTRIATTAFVQEQLTRSMRTLASVAGLNDITAALPIGMTAYVAGQVFIFQKTDGANTGAATLNIGALGALPLNDNTGAALQPGDLELGGWYVVRNISATSWRIIIPSPLPRQLIATATATATAAASTRSTARIAGSWSPNLIADPYLDQTDIGGVAPGWSTAPAIVAKRGMHCVEFPAQGGTAVNSRWSTFLDVSGLAAGTPLSIGVTIAEKNGPSTTGHRLRIYGYDAAGATVSMAGIAGNDVPADSAIPLPSWFAVPPSRIDSLWPLLPVPPKCTSKPST